MAQDTASRKSRRLRALQPSTPLMDFLWGGPERRITGLTLRIIAVNAAALVMLMIGILYLSQYQESLIEAKLETFGTEVELVSTAFSAGADNREQIKNMAQQLGQTMRQRIIVFDVDGKIIVDSYENLDQQIIEKFRHARSKDRLYSVQVLENMASFLMKLIPERRALPPYPDIESKNADKYPDAGDAMLGKTSLSVWTDNADDILLSAAAPLIENEKFSGVVLLLRQAPDIKNDIGIVWMNIIRSFLITLGFMILLSIYLSGTIARPLKKLARAAEAARSGHSDAIEIPDFSARNDEIGELSLVLRDTTRALLNRMDSIEKFASDVAHELKNPLTSVRSAVETLAIVKDKNDHARLLDIILQDVKRMDRLITDISSVSRLDAELSREKLEKISLRHVLQILIESYRDPLQRGTQNTHHWQTSIIAGNVHIHVNANTHEDIFVWGQEMRLLQLFQNLIANALSFSPQNGTIAIYIQKQKDLAIIEIADEGPGIPENRLETIFDRFYSERPQHESFGNHSGLGLSICKQITDALEGKIFATNIRDASGNIQGAQFTVILNAA